MTTRARPDSEQVAAPVAKKARTDEDEKLLIGTVTTFHSTRGYGFVTPDTTGLPDVFAHQSVIVPEDDGYRYLRVGQKVGYVAVQDPTTQKWKATKITTPTGAPLPTRVDPKAKGKKGAEKAATTPALSGEDLHAAVVKQVEYYLSDKNLSRDRWMREQIEATGKQAITVANLLKCNKLKALTTDVKVIQTAVDASAVLYMTTALDNELAIGRGTEEAPTPLPEYTPPIIVLLTDIQGERTWKDVRTGYLAGYGAPVSVQINAPTPFIVVDPEHKASIALAIASGISDVDGNRICSVAEATAEQQNALLQYHYEQLAANAAKSRERALNRGKKDRRGKGNRGPRGPTGPVYVGELKFADTQAVFDKIKGIMRDYKDSQPIMGADKQFMVDLFKNHPRGSEKTQYLREIVVKENEAFDEATQSFFIKKRDNTEEDISYVKCVQNLPTTPPEPEE
jgi:cold shock CspA family protein